VTARVRVKDNGYDRLLKTVERMQSATITVGVHADKGQAQHATKSTGESSAHFTLIDVAIWNEFGLGVPERPFLRGWFDASTSANRDTMAALARSAIKGTRTPEQAIELAGARFVGELQQRIARGEGVKPNAPATIARKGSVVPLVDTGQLRTGITYVVHFRSGSQ